MPISEEQTELNSLLRSLADLAAKPQEQATSMPPAVYTSDKLFNKERMQIFRKQWLCAGRADALANTGDYITYHIDTQPIVLIRQEDRGIKAFANICRHRMMQLLDGRGSCKQKRIVCPYHAWSYKIDGQVIVAPQMDRRPNFDKSQYSLFDIRVECWQGWVYVTLDESLPPVAELLSALQPLLADYAMEHYVEIEQKDHIWNTNWKLLTENFMEGYHLPVAHRATVGANFPIL